MKMATLTTISRILILLLTVDNVYKLDVGAGREEGQQAFFKAIDVGAGYQVTGLEMGLAEFIVPQSIGSESFFMTQHKTGYEYWYNMQARYNLQFSVLSCDGVRLVLSPLSHDVIPQNVYLVEITGHQVQIIQGGVTVTAGYPGLLQCDVERHFWLSWGFGKFTFGRGPVMGVQPLLEKEQARNPLPINAVSFTTMQGTKGSIWRVSHDQGPLGGFHPAAPASDASAGLSGGAIAGIVVGVLILVLVVGGGVYVALNGVPAFASGLIPRAGGGAQHRVGHDTGFDGPGSISYSSQMDAVAS